MHAQVASILNGADLRYLPFLFARIFHAVLSAILVLLLWKPLANHLPAFIPAYLSERSILSSWSAWPNLLIISLIIFSILFILSILIRIIHLVISDER
ncbi:Sporulation integral membrane protein YlbJ [compost metagenome]